MSDNGLDHFVTTRWRVSTVVQEALRVCGSASWTAAAARDAELARALGVFLDSVQGAAHALDVAADEYMRRHKLAVGESK